MSKFILAEKLNMSQVFQAGQAVPVTILRAGPVTVVQIKSQDKDKYSAVQVGFGKRQRASQALAGHTKGLGNFAALVEFRVSDTAGLARGQVITAENFQPGDMVKITGEMKGRGFAGPIKKYGFKGAPASHGHDHPRAVGSIGGRFPQHVRKGKRMAGRMGGSRTVKNLEVVDVDGKRNLMAVKGAVPGAYGGIVKIQTQD